MPELTLEDVQRYKYLFDHGQMPDSDDEVKMEDVLSTQTASQWLPKVITNIMMEAQEPLLVGTRLFTRINYKYGQIINFGAMGALIAGPIGEASEWPERSITTGGSSAQALIGKVGLALKFSEELLRYSQFDIIGMHIREGGRALARYKETKIFDTIRAFGTTVFDNKTPTNAVNGVTHGRGLDGQPNGSITMDDVFDAFKQVMLQGFTPNTMIMHPLTWFMFVKDPVLRRFALNSGGGTFFASWTGSPAQTSWMSALRGGLAGGAGQHIIPGGNAASMTPSAATEYHPQMNSAPTLPSYLGIPFNIIVSPFAHYDPRTDLTDIIVCDATELGMIAVDEDPRTDEFKDPRNDILKIRLWERYGLAALHEGQHTAVIKNVKVIANEIVLPPQATIDVSGAQLAPIPAGTAIV